MLVSTPSLPDGGLGVRIALRRDAARSPTTWTWTRRVPRGYSASTWRKRGKVCHFKWKVRHTCHCRLIQNLHRQHPCHVWGWPLRCLKRLPRMEEFVWKTAMAAGRFSSRTRRILRRSAPRSFWPLRPLLPNCAHGTAVVPCAWRFARDGRSWVSGVKMRGSFNHSAWTFTAVYAGSGRGQQKNDIASTGFRFVAGSPGDVIPRTAIAA